MRRVLISDPGEFDYSDLPCPMEKNEIKRLQSVFDLWLRNKTSHSYYNEGLTEVTVSNKTIQRDAATRRP